MAQLLKRRLALGVALVALLAGGTAVALGATGGGTNRSGSHRTKANREDSLLPAAARYLGMSVVQLRQDLKSGKTLGQIADATGGRSEAGLIAALVAAREARMKKQQAKLPVQVTALVKLPGGRRQHSARRESVHAAVLSYLGLSHEALVAELHRGKSLAEVADATPGKSSAGLTEAILAVGAKRLEAAVAAGRLTKADEATRLTALRAHVVTLLARKHAAKRSHGATASG
jgi:hypothetical protein